MQKNKNYHLFIVGTLRILAVLAILGGNGQAYAAQPKIDVAVTIIANHSRVKQGQTVTYTVTATNLGSDPAPFVDVIHGLSDQLNIVSLTCGKGINPDGTFCEYSILEPGESAVSTLVATPKPNGHNRERIATTNVQLAFENADTVDSNSKNNTASVSIILVGKQDHH